jgi:hypothetical protein
MRAVMLEYPRLPSDNRECMANPQNLPRTIAAAQKE